MCGLAGFVGVPKAQAWGLVYGLGAGIDLRGGHASGYVAVRDEKMTLHKKIGEWSTAPRRFVRGAAKGDICMMHARWATCGIKDSIDHAHPFEIVRNGETVLYGAHNGIIYDGAEESAKANGRPYTVDSREVFELLADENFEAIANLDGYGVLTWICPGDKFVNMVRLSSHSDIEIVQLRAGGLVWGSTMDIISEAAELAGLRIKATFAVPEIGVTYKICGDNLYETRNPKIEVGKIPWYMKTNPKECWTDQDVYSPESWESALIEKWEREQAEIDEKTGRSDEKLYSSWERDEEETQQYPSIAEAYE